ncbi:MAG: DUF1844 domain-containing protein [Phycisphaerae bacterium]|jgi:hypothetical protein
MPDDAPKSEEKPKIVVDDDWKAQAKAEKEKLAQQAASAKPAGIAAAGAAGAKGAAAQQPRELPPASFTTLVSSLVTQIFLSLGGMEDPQTKRRYVDLDLARHHIETLAMLEEKTRGNLAEDEKKLLDKALYETRMQYVQLAQRL